MKSNISKTVVLIGILGASVPIALAEDPPSQHLPMDLNFTMSKADVLSHMKAMAMYRIADTKPTKLAYVVTAPDTNTKSAWFPAIKK